VQRKLDDIAARTGIIGFGIPYWIRKLIPFLQLRGGDTVAQADAETSALSGMIRSDFRRTWCYDL